MYSRYLKFEKILAKIELFFVVIPFILIFITVVEQVFQRYFWIPGVGNLYLYFLI